MRTLLRPSYWSRQVMCYLYVHVYASFAHLSRLIIVDLLSVRAVWRLLVVHAYKHTHSLSRSRSRSLSLFLTHTRLMVVHAHTEGGKQIAFAFLISAISLYVSLRTCPFVHENLLKLHIMSLTGGSSYVCTCVYMGTCDCVCVCGRPRTRACVSARACLRTYIHTHT